MTHAAAQSTGLYGELEALSPNLVGEIISGRLYAHARPAGPHALASSSLGADLLGAFQRGRGGPGGWWIIDEPELHFVRDQEVLVPDIAGWRRERMPQMPADQRFQVVPDWVCEVVSPSSVRTDRSVKMPVYARFGVAYLWLVDPLVRTLETFALDDGRWAVTGHFKNGELIAAPPFHAVTLELAALWADGSQEPAG
jgi:Uma2 family endonuclease